ncbi:DUF417 family protein [Microbulbifer sp. SSSA007]|uniref:DUF417 family protein n=1 Tax=Microbulbifer sp. SSSA007 TaxID=3243379 RepID=UPI0040395DCB
MMNICLRKLPFALLAISFALLAAALFSGQQGGLGSIMAFYGFEGGAGLSRIATAVAIIFTIAALLSVLSIFIEKFILPLALLIIALSIVPLLSLFGSTHWIDALGGFPAIGSGQGVIKYFSLIIIGLTWLSYKSAPSRKYIWLNFLPVGLVLLWIGGMKFTAIEAQGIEGLVNSSPLMSWLYNFFSVQQASNIIGVYDLLALVILAIGIHVRALFWPGVLLCGAVFVTTQTFLLSYPGSWEKPWVLASSGIFIIKDLWFIANLIIMISFRHQICQSNQAVETSKE